MAECRGRWTKKQLLIALILSGLLIIANANAEPIFEYIYTAPDASEYDARLNISNNTYDKYMPIAEDKDNYGIRILDIKLQKQECSVCCSHAATQAVEGYYGITETQREIARYGYGLDRLVYIGEIKAYLEGKGFNVERYQDSNVSLQFERIKKAIDQGTLVIVMRWHIYVDRDGNEIKFNHYDVVVGYSDSKIYFKVPNITNLRSDKLKVANYTDFEENWRDLINEEPYQMLVIG